MINSVMLMLLANGYDLVYTLILVYGGLAVEANPLVAPLFAFSIWAAIAYKLIFGVAWAFGVTRLFKDHPRFLDGVMYVATLFLIVAPTGVLSWLY